MSLEVMLRHRFAGAASAIEFDFALPEPGVCALFGPSGAGKSTLIAACAGLLRPDACRVVVDGEVLADTARGIWLAPERRRVGVVFQGARLFPHMSVARNLRFGQRRAPPGPDRFDELVALLGIGALLRRRPATLSGGERQRVAIGRALLARPRLLLLDEPLSGLDDARKAEILPYLARLKQAAGLPMLYVTHAMDEVARLADTLVLIEAGRLLAAGPLAALSARADLGLARRDDAAAVLDCRVAAHETARGLTRLACGPARLLVPLLPFAEGAAVRVRIPAREVILAAPEAIALAERISLQNLLAGSVRAIAEDAGHGALLVEVAIGPGALLSRVTPDAASRLGLAPGQPVLALIKSVAIDVL